MHNSRVIEQLRARAAVVEPALWAAAAIPVALYTHGAGVALYAGALYARIAIAGALRLRADRQLQDA